MRPCRSCRHDTSRATLISADGAYPVEELRGRTVAAFAGIGNPAAFRRTLEDLGANVIDFRTYPDHHGLYEG